MTSATIAQVVRLLALCLGLYGLAGAAQTGTHVFLESYDFEQGLERSLLTADMIASSTSILWGVLLFLTSGWWGDRIAGTGSGRAARVVEQAPES